MGQSASSPNDKNLDVDNLMLYTDVSDNLHKHRNDEISTETKDYVAFDTREAITKLLKDHNDKKNQSSGYADDGSSSVQQLITSQLDESSSESDEDANVKGHDHDLLVNLHVTKQVEQFDICSARSHPIIVEGSCVVGGKLTVNDLSTYSSSFPIQQLSWNSSLKVLDDYTFSPNSFSNATTVVIFPDLYGHFIKVAARRVIEFKTKADYKKSAGVINMYNLNEEQIIKKDVISYFVVGPVTCKISIPAAIQFGGKSSFLYRLKDIKVLSEEIVLRNFTEISSDALIDEALTGQRISNLAMKDDSIIFVFKEEYNDLTLDRLSEFSNKRNHYFVPLKALKFIYMLDGIVIVSISCASNMKCVFYLNLSFEHWYVLTYFIAKTYSLLETSDKTIFNYLKNGGHGCFDQEPLKSCF